MLEEDSIGIYKNVVNPLSILNHFNYSMTFLGAEDDHVTYHDLKFQKSVQQSFILKFIPRRNLFGESWSISFGQSWMCGIHREP